MSHRLELRPDYGPYYGLLDGSPITSIAQIPVSDDLRAAIHEWWQAGYGDTDPRPDLDDNGYEQLTRDLASRLRDEAGSDWLISWEL